MIFRLSKGMRKALGEGVADSGVILNSNTVSFTTNQILDTGKCGIFARHDFVKVKEGVNAGIKAKVISADADQLTFAADTFTAVAAGAQISIEKINGGAGYVNPLTNGVLRLFSSPMPLSANDSEGTATLLAEITLNGNAFVAGTSENGLNLSWNATDGRLEIAIDPETGVAEGWKGVGLDAGTVAWGRFYANDLTTGASEEAVRFDGDAGDTQNAFFYMPNGRILTVGGNVTVTKGEMDFRGGS